MGLLAKWLGDDLLVRSPGRRQHWRLLAWILTMLLVGWGSVIALALLPYGHPLRVIPSVAMGLYIMTAATARFRRVSAYRNGWANGRTEMMASLREAGRRRMYYHEWIELEGERTVAVFGVKTEERADEAVRDRAGIVGRVRAAWRRRGLRRVWRWLGSLGGRSSVQGPDGVAERDEAVQRRDAGNGHAGERPTGPASGTDEPSGGSREG